MSTAIAQHINEDAWLAARRSGIGGSEVAAIFGLNPFLSARDVWLEKTGRALEKKITPDMRRGRRLESIAVQVYEETTGRRTRRQPMRRHPDYPVLMASIDRQVIATDRLPTVALEAKAPRARVFYRMKREGLPERLILQGQMEALVWGYPWTDFAIYGADDDAMLTYPVPFDDRVGARIIEVVPEWFTRHVINDVEPADNAPVPDVKLPEVEGTVTKRDDEEFRAAAHEYFEARELAKEAELLKDVARDRIVQLIDDKVGIYQTPDHERFYYQDKIGNVKHAETVKALRRLKPVDPLRLAAVLTGVVNIAILAEAVDQSRINIDALETRGKGSRSLVGYQLKAEEE